MSRSGRRGIRAIAVAAVVALALTGCVSWFQPHRSSTTSTPSSEKVAADLEPYYGQVLRWSACDSGFQCTTAIAPLDWAHPTGARIHLALIRHLATGTSEGSLLVNPGGPGASGYDFVRDSLSYAVDSTLEEHFDVVGFDPRGVNHSSAVKCYDSDSQLTHFIYDITPGTPGTDAWLTASENSYKSFAEGCEKLTGALLAHVDTVSAARDLDMLRAALGDTKLNYLGYSYGTLLGATYAGLFPKKVGRLVLDGALDPETTHGELLEVQAIGFEDAMRDYLKNCLTRKGCPFSGTVDSSMQRVRDLLASVQTSPWPGNDGRELGATTLFTAIIYPLYSRDTWTYEDRLWEDLAQHSSKIAFILADAYNSRNTDGSYADNSTEAFVAINCLDYPVETDPAVLRAQSAKIVAAAPTFGLQLSYDTSCIDWPYKPTRTPGPITAAGSGPIVVIGNTGDPATPYRWAQGLARELKNGHLITYHGEGHTSYNKGNDCVDNAVDDYFVHGTVPKTGLSCT